MSVSHIRYKAFISYSHADRKCAEWLLKALEAYKIPKSLVGRQTENGTIPARLSPIFRDRDELPAAHKLTDRLFQALRASEYLIVLCSPRSAKSRLVNREIIEFKKAHGDGHVLCMIIDGTPFADNPEDECFPEALRHSFMADGSKAGLSAEGLAADLRPEGDGKRMALMKLVAGLIGVGLNDIVRREGHRQQKRMLALIAASIVGMATMGTLTYRAEVAKEEAAKARTIAIQQKNEMWKQLDQNDELLHTMMTEMFDKMLEHGNLDTLDKVITSVLASFKQRDLTKISRKQLFHYTGAMLRYGQNLDRKGNSDRAREIFSEVLEISRRFYHQNPNTSEAIGRLQNNLFFTGYLALRQGRIEDAERDYRERLAILKDARDRHASLVYMHGRSNNTARWNIQISDTLMGLAHILAGPRGQPEAAIPLHQSSIKTLKTAMSEDPDTYPTARNYQLGSAYHYAGDTYLLVGRFDDAEKMFSSRLAIFEKMVSEKPENYRAFRRILTSKTPLARIARYRGDYVTARNLQEEVAQGFDRLTQKDPNNTMWLGDSAKAQIDLAETAFAAKDFVNANAYLKKGKAQITEALTRDATRPKRWLTFHRAQILEAELDYAQGNIEGAKTKLIEALADQEAKEANYLNMANTKEHLAGARLFYGQLLADAGDRQAATKEWRKLIDLLENSTSSISLQGKETMVMAYKLLGSHDRAMALSNELKSYGYHLTNVMSDNATMKH